jgi:hypothetical protein
MKAAELLERSKSERASEMRSELDHLALSYLRLADQAERNAATDIVYETPTTPSQHVAQQQQQPQPDIDSEKDG